MDNIQNLVQTENGPRYAMTGSYKGVPIEVATGYDPIGDYWRVHVYTGEGAARKKVNAGMIANRQSEAFPAGFAVAQHSIDGAI